MRKSTRSIFILTSLLLSTLNLRRLALKQQLCYLSLLFAVAFTSTTNAQEIIIIGTPAAFNSGVMSPFMGENPPSQPSGGQASSPSFIAQKIAEAKKAGCENAKRQIEAAENICVANAKTDKGINQATCSNFSYTVSPNITFKIGSVISGGVTGSVTYASGAGCREDWANLADAQIAWCKVNTSNATVAAYKAGGACEGQ